MNHQLIERLYAADGQFLLAVTGGGTSAISQLFSVPGASGTIIEATVPYHPASLTQYLQSSASLNCSTATARAMAMMSYQRARQMNTGQPVFGVGATAAIATSRSRRGSDRCHVAIQSADQSLSVDLLLDKTHDRQTQEALCADVILHGMATAAGQESRFPDHAVVARCDASTEWQQLLAGESDSTASRGYDVIFPGAFNPLHDGHRAMMAVACEKFGDGALEISIRNVDKPPIDFLTMQERHTDEFDVVFTNTPTFIEKSRLFPGAVFVVGLDTVVRIDDPKYYASGEDRDDALDMMAGRGIRFLVFGRQVHESFQTLSDVELSPALTAMCIEVSEDEFRADISSTELRRS